MARTIDQHRALVEALYQKASGDGIHWEESSSGGVKTFVGGATILLTKEVDFNDQPSTRVEILNDSGQVVDTFDDNYFGDLKPQHVAFQNYWQLMSELYTVGLRSARGADKILETLLSSLNAKEVDPPKPPKNWGDLDDDLPF